MSLVFNLLSIRQINLADLLCPIPLKYGPMNENCLEGCFLKQAISAKPNPPGKGVVIAVPGSYLLRSYRVVTAVRWGRGHPQESRSMQRPTPKVHNLPATLTPKNQYDQSQKRNGQTNRNGDYKVVLFCDGLNPLMMESCTLWN